MAGSGITVVKHNQNPKFISYAWSTDFIKRQIIKLVYRGEWNYFFFAEDLKKIKIPVPKLEEQEKVVEFLDKLYTITNDINSGIPLLIEKIQKQYDFYKEVLINPE